jgi:hypothetical protein
MSVMRAVRVAAATGVATLGAISPASAAPQRPAVATATALTITITEPVTGASYERGSQIVAHFRCSEGGSTIPIATCKGTTPTGHTINTRSAGTKSFTVTATDTSGNKAVETVHYTVWAYVNPLRAVAPLHASRIDMGVDYSGSGPILAIGEAKVIFARANVSGPESCWGRTCAPPGSGMVVYRLLDGPFAGNYVYAVENISVRVKAGQTVGAGEPVAILHEGSPNLEIGWAAGRGAETLAIKDGHQCTCIDPGGWSSIEGRNFDHLLVWLGAPSGYLQSIPPNQRMPRGWPTLPAGPPRLPPRRR